MNSGNRSHSQQLPLLYFTLLEKLIARLSHYFLNTSSRLLSRTLQINAMALDLAQFPVD